MFFSSNGKWYCEVKDKNNIAYLLEDGSRFSVVCKAIAFLREENTLEREKMCIDITYPKEYFGDKCLEDRLRSLAKKSGCIIYNISFDGVCYTIQLVEQRGSPGEKYLFYHKDIVDKDLDKALIRAIEEVKAVIEEDEFEKHLNKASETVGQWPVWKQELLGGTAKTEPTEVKKESRRSWDSYFMEIAESISTRSIDPVTKHGTVIVDKDKNIVATGCNGPIAGINDSKVPLTRPEKYFHLIHSEINAILRARRDITGMTVYITGEPCVRCLLILAQAGISKIVYGDRKSNCIDEFDQTQKQLILDLMKEAGKPIEIIQYSQE